MSKNSISLQKLLKQLKFKVHYHAFTGHDNTVVVFPGYLKIL